MDIEAGLTKIHYLKKKVSEFQRYSISILEHVHQLTVTDVNIPYMVASDANYNDDITLVADCTMQKYLTGTARIIIRTQTWIGLGRLTKTCIGLGRLTPIFGYSIRSLVQVCQRQLCSEVHTLG